MSKERIPPDPETESAATLPASGDPALEKFIGRWSDSGASERANYQIHSDRRRIPLAHRGFLPHTCHRAQNLTLLFFLKVVQWP